jgi:uncharacterized protein (UPF0333 family)
MNKIYFIILLSAIICGAYFYGVNITKANCRANYAEQNFLDIQQTQQHKREIHEVVYKTGVADIRRILRDKYSIAE